MSEELATPIQADADVSARRVVIPVLVALGTAILVMALLAGAFQYMLGIWPTNMTEQQASEFPAPRLQVNPAVDLLEAEQRQRRDLDAGAMPIDAAMSRLLKRDDPLAPLLAPEDVPDSPAKRAMAAQFEAGGARGSGLAPAGVTAGAGTDAMAPPAGDETPNMPGLEDEDTRVPASELSGTPTYRNPDPGSQSQSGGSE